MINTNKFILLRFVIRVVFKMNQTKYIKTCTELSHPGCLLLQFYALNNVFNPQTPPYSIGEMQFGHWASILNHVTVTYRSPSC